MSLRVRFTHFLKTGRVKKNRHVCPVVASWVCLMHCIHQQYSCGGGSDRKSIENRAQLDVFGPKHARVRFSADHAKLQCPLSRGPFDIDIFYVPPCMGQRRLPLSLCAVARRCLFQKWQPDEPVPSVSSDTLTLCALPWQNPG